MMKTYTKYFIISCFVFSICLLNSQIYAQWTEINSPTTSDIISLDFQDENYGYIYSSDGLYKTIDGGINWNIVTASSGDVNIFNALTILEIISTPSADYVLGFEPNGDHYIMNSTDGIEWSVIFTNATPINDIDAYGNDLYAFGNNGLAVEIDMNSLQATNLAINGTDGDFIGGEGVYDPQGFTNTHIWFDGFLVSSNESVYLPEIVDLRASSSNIMSAITETSLHVTTNRWSSYTSNDFSDIVISNRCVEHNTDSRIFIGGENGIFYNNSFYTPDYLSYFPSATGYNVNVIDCTDYNECYAACDNGKILYTSNGGGITQPVFTINAPLSGCINSNTYISLDGPSNNDYYWFINGQSVGEQGTGYSINEPIPGEYEILVIADNGTFQDTSITTITLFEDIDANVIATISNPLLCNIGNSDILIQNTNEDYEYALVPLGTNNPINPPIQGNGSTISLNTGMLTDTSSFRILIKLKNSNCFVYSLNTFTVNVERVISSFYPTEINVRKDESVVFKNHSYGATNYDWDFGLDANDNGGSQSFEPSVTYSSEGAREIEMIASSETGCSDTLSRSIHIYDPSTLEVGCWSQIIGYSSDVYGYISDVHYADDENLYVSGGHSHTFLPSKIGIEQGPYEQENSGGFLAKYDQFGVLRWSIITDHSDSGGIAEPIISSSGDVYVQVGGSGVLFNGVEIIGDEMQNSDVHVIKINSQGELQWIFPIDNVGLPSIAMDANENIYMAGHTHIWAPSPIFTDTNGYSFSPDTGGATLYIAKFNSDGQFQWLNYIEPDNGNYYWRFYDIDVNDQGELVILGSHSSGSTLYDNNGNFVKHIDAYNNSNHFIVKYDENGNYLWDNSIYVESDSPEFASIAGIEISQNGDIYVGGTSDCDQSDELLIFQSSNQENQAIITDSYFVSKYDSDGNILWAQGINIDFHFIAGTEIELDNSEEYLYTTGNAGSGVGYDPPYELEFHSQNDINRTLTLSNGSIYLIKYDLEGNIVEATTENGTHSYKDGGGTLYALSAGKSNNEELIFGAGPIGGTGTTGVPYATDNLISSDPENLVLACFTEACMCSNQVKYVDTLLCEGENIYGYDESGTYEFIMDETGCDTLSIHLNLDIFDISTTSLSISENDGILTATSSIGLNDILGYAWYLDDEIIAGENENTLQTIEDGSYTVEVFHECSSLLSAPYIINTTSIGNANPDVYATDISPIPAYNYIDIRFTSLPHTILLSNLEGKEILFSHPRSIGNIKMDVSNLPNGIYLIKLVYKDKIIIHKVAIAR